MIYYYTVDNTLVDTALKSTDSTSNSNSNSNTRSYFN